MSLYKDKYLSLAGIDLNGLTAAELHGLTRELLESRCLLYTSDAADE